MLDFHEPEADKGPDDHHPLIFFGTQAIADHYNDCFVTAPQMNTNQEKS